MGLCTFTGSLSNILACQPQKSPEQELRFESFVSWSSVTGAAAPIFWRFKLIAGHKALIKETVA